MAQRGVRLPAQHMAREQEQQHGSGGGPCCHGEKEEGCAGVWRPGWHVAGIGPEPQATEGQQGCGREAMAVL